MHETNVARSVANGISWCIRSLLDHRRSAGYPAHTHVLTHGRNLYELGRSIFVGVDSNCGVRVCRVHLLGDARMTNLRSLELRSLLREVLNHKAAYGIPETESNLYRRIETKLAEELAADEPRTKLAETLHAFGAADWIRRKDPAEMVRVAQACMDALDQIQLLESVIESRERALGFTPLPDEPFDDWRPIETAPRDVIALFWVRPSTKEDGKYYCDTNGNPILAKNAQPYAVLGKYGSWSSLMKGTHWKPVAGPSLNRGAEPT